MVQQMTLDGKALKVKQKKPRQREKLSSNADDRKQLAQYSRSVWAFRDPPRQGKQKEQGATFSKEMAKRVVWIYSEKGETVLDPFLGTGTTLEACVELGRNFRGFELNPAFYQNYVVPTLSQERLGSVQLSAKAWNCDCRDLLQHVEPESVRLTFTSPPYANFIQKSAADRARRADAAIFKGIKALSHVKQYSDDPRDFGNLDYEGYLGALGELFGLIYAATQPDGYCIFLVKDGRACEDGIPYIPVHSDIATVAGHAGFVWHDTIPIDQNENRKLMLNGSKRHFYVNQNTSYLVVLWKRPQAEG